MTSEVSKDLEYRKAFIADWRARNAVLLASIADERNVHRLDARKCQGEVKQLVIEALDANLERIKAASVSTPLRLSPEALRALDRGQFHSDVGGGE